MRKTTLTYALLATGLLVLAGAATPVLADGDHEDRRGPNRGPGHGDDNSTADQRAADHRHHRGHNLSAHPHFAELRAACAEYDAAQNGTSNATMNASFERRCDRIDAAHDGDHKARRAAHALLGAIAALERRIERINATIADLQNGTADGNETADNATAGNATADNETDGNVTAKIERLQAHLERAEARVAHLKERLEALHEKWASVREHVESRRHGGGDDDDDDQAEDESDDADDGADDDESEDESDDE